MFKIGSKKGFSLIELLIAVAIISLLSVTVLLNIAKSRDRAEAAVLAAQLHEIKNALIAYKLDEQVHLWWEKDDGSGVHGKTINELRSFLPRFDGYIGEVETTPSNYNVDYQYFNFGTDYNCGGTDYYKSGVTIRLDGLSVGDGTITDILDQEFDGGDGGTCGRIKWGGTSDSVYFLIASTTLGY